MVAAIMAMIINTASVPVTSVSAPMTVTATQPTTAPCACDQRETKPIDVFNTFINKGAEIIIAREVNKMQSKKVAADPAPQEVEDRHLADSMRAKALAAIESMVMDCSAIATSSNNRELNFLMLKMCTALETLVADHTPDNEAKLHELMKEFDKLNAAVNAESPDDA